MPLWEYMDVRIWNGMVVAINGDLLKLGNQPNWIIWRNERGLERWELASEVSFKSLSVHATLKREIASKHVDLGL